MIAPGPEAQLTTHEPVAMKGGTLTETKKEDLLKIKSGNKK